MRRVIPRLEEPRWRLRPWCCKQKQYQIYTPCRSYTLSLPNDSSDADADTDLFAHKECSGESFPHNTFCIRQALFYGIRSRSQLLRLVRPYIFCVPHSTYILHYNAAFLLFRLSVHVYAHVPNNINIRPLDSDMNLLFVQQ